MGVSVPGWSSCKPVECGFRAYCLSRKFSGGGQTCAMEGEVRCSGVVRRASSARGGLARGRVAQGLVYSSTTPHMIYRHGHVPLSELVIGTLPVM